MRRVFSGFLVAAGVAVAMSSASAQDVKRSIEQVKGDVYRFQNNFHYAMFVVTDEGIVVTDPINAEAVGWLKAELANRFNKPVTHMIYSHTHGDHASGGEAWGEGIEVIAHDQAKKNVMDGKVKTAMPTKTFADTHTMEIGGKTFEMTYLGNGHGDDMIVTIVRPENVAFVVDVVSPGRVPFRDFPGVDVAGLLEQIKKVEALDYEIITPGHGPLGKKQDATDQRVYIEKLMAAVKKGLAEGKSVDEIVAADPMSEYKDWGAYKDWAPLNIQGMAKWLQEQG